MAEAGNPLQRNFEAAADAASQPSTDWILDMARGAAGGAAGAQPPAAPAAGAGGGAGAAPKAGAASPQAGAADVPPPTQGQSWGHWFEDLVNSKAATAAAAAEEAAGQAGQAMGRSVGGVVGREFMGRGAANWEALKSDWEASHPPLEAFKNADFWEANKKQFEATVAAGKLPLDAFGLVMTPISTALGLGAKAGAKALNAISPTLFPEEQTAQDIEKAMVVLGPRGGGLRTALTERPPPGAVRDFLRRVAANMKALEAADAAAGGETAGAPAAGEAMLTPKPPRGAVPDEPITSNWESRDLSSTSKTDLAYVSKHVTAGNTVHSYGPFGSTDLGIVGKGEGESRLGELTIAGKPAVAYQNGNRSVNIVMRSSDYRELTPENERPGSGIPGYKPDDSLAIVGTAKIEPDGTLEHVVVSPAIRRQGIGTTLLNLAEDHLNAKVFAAPDISEQGAALLENYRQSGMKAAAEAAAAAAPPEVPAFGYRPKENREFPEDNYTKDLSHYTERLYHETDPDEALKYIPQADMIANVMKPPYLADTPDLALSQKENAGVLLEFDSKGINGQINTDKPALQYTFTQGAGEYKSGYNEPSRFHQNLRAIRIQDNAQISPAFRTRWRDYVEPRLRRDGWIKTKGDGYTQWERPPPEMEVNRPKTPLGQAGHAAPAPAPTVTMKTPEGPKPIQVTPELQAQLKNYVEGKGGESPIEVTIETLANPATRAEAIADVAKILPKDEVKPVAVSQANAYAIGMTPDEIMARIRPNFPSDEAFAAAGAVLHSASETFWNAARRYAETGTAEDRAVAERALAVLNKYIGDFRAGGTDLGRGMRIRQEVTESTPEHLASIQKMVSEAAGEDLESILKKAAAIDDPKKVSGWLSRLRSMNLRDTLVYAWQNALLSNPKSVFKEFLSDLFTASWDTGVRGIAETSGGVPSGSTQTLAYGYVSSFLDSLRLAARALTKGQSQFAPEYQSIEGNVVKAKSHIAELAKGMAKPGENETPGQAAVRYLRMALPTQWQMAADDFNKSWHYNAYRRMYAYEQAGREANDPAAVTSRMRQILENTPENIHEAAMAKALQNSFQEPLQGNLGRMADFVENANLGPGGQVPVGRFIMPFTKVPANLSRWPVRNTPLAAITRRYWDDVAAGGSRKSLANAAVGLGAGVVSAAIPLAYNDMLTGYGPHDPDTRRFWLQTHQPYSFKDPKGGWHSYIGLGPLAMVLGPVADTADVMRFAKTGQADDVENALWSAAFGAGQAMLAPANMMGVGNFFDAIMNPEDNAKYFGENLVTAVAVPQAVWGIERAMDPWRRAHYDLLDNIISHTPGLSKDLPPQVDIWGDKVRWPQGEFGPWTGTPAADALSPIAYKPPGEANPIDTWIYENRLSFPRGEEGRIIGPPGRVQTYSSGGVQTQVQLSPEQHYRIKTLAGNALKDPETKLGAKDLLNALVTGSGPRDLQREWNAGSPELKAEMVLRIWTKYRNAAKQQLLAEDDDLRGKVTDGLRVRAQALTRGSGGVQAPLAQPQLQ